MKLKALLIAAVAMTAPACTTVDMTAMGGGSALGVTQTSEPNVVEKATSKLFALFSSKGWSTHDSRKKVQSAASVLLNGLDAKTLSDNPSPYLSTLTSADALRADMRDAVQHVDQTVRAAEVFLTMAGPDEDIREELSDLEQALLASRQAEKIFTEASSTFGAADEVARLGETVDRLRDVTDEFGRRVRRAQNRSVVAVSGSAFGT